MSLRSGTYFIKSKSTEGGFIGRHYIEDRTLLPKRVLLLPSDCPRVPKWNITRHDDKGTYTLSTQGAHTSIVNKSLFAILINEPGPAEWKIKAQPQDGRNTYTILEAHNSVGWFCPETDYDQVVIRELNMPRFPLNELFEIIPCDRD